MAVYRGPSAETQMSLQKQERDVITSLILGNVLWAMPGMTTMCRSKAGWSSNTDALGDLR